jgi:N(2)-fixation sustaining protein CowN
MPFQRMLKAFKYAGNCRSTGLGGNLPPAAREGAGECVCRSFVQRGFFRHIHGQGEQILMATKNTDRYVTFKGIQGDANAKRVIELLLGHVDREGGNPFWDKFKQKVAQTGAEEKPFSCRTDELFLVHCYINNIRELFELHEDREALALLQQVEEESC